MTPDRLPYKTALENASNDELIYYYFDWYGPSPSSRMFLESNLLYEVRLAAGDYARRYIEKKLGKDRIVVEGYKRLHLRLQELESKVSELSKRRWWHF